MLQHIYISSNTEFQCQSIGESARYKELKEDKYYIPDDWDDDMKEILKSSTENSYRLYHLVYKTLQDKGMDKKRAKESARFFLPYANQTEMDISFNWRSFAHFLGLRRDSHAQKEVADVAQEMLRLVKNIEGNPFKHTIEAFESCNLLGDLPCI